MADLASLTTLATFDGTDGSNPEGPLFIDAQGDLFGTTQNGGAANDGTAFEIAKAGGGYASATTTLASFTGENGANPSGGLAADASGNLDGLTALGGASNDGTLFSLTANGQSGPTVLASFDGTNGLDPVGVPLIDSGGNIIGVTESGGANNEGSVFLVAPGAASPTTLVSFDGTDGSAPLGGLVADAAGDLFGTTSAGGANNDGTIFEIAKTAGGYASTPTILFSFQPPPPPSPMEGPPPPENPQGPLTIDANGDLFGTAANFGGSSGAAFELAKTAQGYASGITTIAGFDGQDGAHPNAALIEDAAGNLFGMTPSGGADSDGTVFEIQNAAQGYHLVDIYDLTAANADPTGGLAVDATGDLFGTSSSGSSNSGTVFELTNTGFESVALNGAIGGQTTTDHEAINPFATATINDLNPNQIETVTVTNAIPANGTFSHLGNGSYDASTGIYTDSGTPQAVTADLQGLVFTPTEGRLPPGESTSTDFTVTITDSDGATSTNNTTSVIATVSPAVYTQLAGFDGSYGILPEGLVADSAGNLFGTTAAGGADGNGTIFEIAKTDSGYAAPTLLVDFNGSDGIAPEGLVTDANGDLFGTTNRGGGPNDAGTIFEIAHTASGYASTPTTLASFDGADGRYAAGQLLMDSAGDLFGTTSEGGSGGGGTVFELANSGNGYAATPTTLANFDATNGAQPNPGLVMDANGDLFGTTYSGGANQYGTIFEIAHTASGYAPLTTLYDFTSNNAIGYRPSGPLLIDSSGKLYGTTDYGGAGNEGTIYALSLNGGSYASAPTLLTAFTGVNPGGAPEGLLEMDAAGNIFGTTESGNADAQGALFELAKTSTGYSTSAVTLYAFDHYSGLQPVTDSAGDLFGTSFGGGPNHNGAVFEISNAEFTASTTTPGATLTANDMPGQQLTGTPYNDTFYAGHSSVVMTSGGGADTFVFQYTPWSAGSITDFSTVTDKLDLSALLSAAGYSGTDPVGDGYLQFTSDGHGNTQVYLDSHSASDPYPSLITTLDNVAPSNITRADYGYGSSSGGGAITISGTVADQSAINQESIRPFADVTISDTNSGATETVTVTLSPGNDGTLSNFDGGTYDTSTSVYTVSGTLAQVNAALAGLVFTPDYHPAFAGQTITTGFTISDSDNAGATASDNTTSIDAIYPQPQLDTLANLTAATGGYPVDSLITDSAGNLYGTALKGGANGEGTVFEIANNSGSYAGSPTVLASFDGADGA
ncbi:MAG TPA: type I secretion C-terminal target domain-containing protein, partial [Stellaceae bacterium]|nr:type I secretion C-terminal target domain-containing protein [Stellaceae bacterium]